MRRRSHGRPFDVQIRLSLSFPNGSARYAFTITGDRLEEYRVKSEEASVRDGSTTHEYSRSPGWSGPEGLAPRLDEQSLALTTLGGDQRFKGLADSLSRLTVYSIFPDMLREPQKFDPTHPMKRHGENWVSILRELLKQPTKSDLIAGLRKVTGDIEDARVSTAAGYLIAEFKQTGETKKDKRWFDAAQQSDGTLRVAGLLTALLQSPSLFLMGIEEPELTVHPGALPLIYDYLRQASEVSQILITTHSPIILDVVDIERDAILVVEREAGVTQIRKAGAAQLRQVRERLLSLGALFLSGDLQLSLFEPLES